MSTPTWTYTAAIGGPKGRDDLLDELSLELGDAFSDWYRCDHATTGMCHECVIRAVHNILKETLDAERV